MSTLLFLPGGIGPWEIGLIMLVALLLFGGRKIPQLAKDLGTGIREFRKSLTESARPELIEEDEDVRSEKPVSRKSGRKKTRA